MNNFHPDRVMGFILHNQVPPALNQIETDDIAAIASLDTKQTAFFDRRDPEMVKWIAPQSAKREHAALVNAYNPHHPRPHCNLQRRRPTTISDTARWN